MSIKKSVHEYFNKIMELIYKYPDIFVSIILISIFTILSVILIRKMLKKIDKFIENIPEKSGPIYQIPIEHNYKNPSDKKFKYWNKKE